MRRRVFERLEPPYFVFAQTTDGVEGIVPGFRVFIAGNKGVVPEDLYFCRKARDAGFRTFVDTETVLPHITPATATPAYADGEWSVYVRQRRLDRPQWGLARVTADTGRGAGAADGT